MQRNHGQPGIESSTVEPESGLDPESSVQSLFFRLEVAGRVCHRDHFRRVNLVGLPAGYECRRAFGDDILHPIGVLAVGESDQEAAVVRCGNDGRPVSLARLASDVTDDRVVRPFLPG